MTHSHLQHIDGVLLPQQPTFSLEDQGIPEGTVDSLNIFGTVGPGRTDGPIPTVDTDENGIISHFNICF